jgi:hypothetical protein
MATTKTCRRCGIETHFSKMSMLDYYDLCYSCQEKEEDDRALVVSNKLRDRGYFQEQANTLINIHRHNVKKVHGLKTNNRITAIGTKRIFDEYRSKIALKPIDDGGKNMTQPKYPHHVKIALTNDIYEKLKKEVFVRSMMGDLDRSASDLVILNIISHIDNPNSSFPIFLDVNILEDEK